MPDEREAARLVDYERTVATIHQLTEVRFKLAAFLPALTGAAVALLANSKLGPLTAASLAAGGLVISLGIVLYDLRNSQIYNAAIGRAKALEAILGFDTFDGDLNCGLFGSRADTIRRKQEKGLDHFLRLRVQHGSGLRWCTPPLSAHGYGPSSSRQRLVCSDHMLKAGYGWHRICSGWRSPLPS